MEAAGLAHRKQTAAAKQTALALANLASDNESKALKLALKHLRLLKLAGRKRKVEGKAKEKRKRKGMR